MNHICVDLETLDTRATSVFLSLAAIQFDLEGNIGKQFKMNVELRDAMKHGLTVGAGTLQFWLEQKPETMKLMFDNPYKLKDVLIGFIGWIEDLGIEKPKVWGNSARFDLGILMNAYEKLEINAPWNFRDEYCYRTIKNLFPAIQHSYVGEAHDPLSDCRNQILLLQRIYKFTPLSSSDEKLTRENKIALELLREIAENNSAALGGVRSRILKFLNSSTRVYSWDINKKENGENKA